MTPVSYIRVDIDVLNLQISDKAKLLLGLTKSFNNRGLIISNPELGKLLNCSGDNISRLLKEIETHIRIENPQSKYRKIFYSGLNAEVNNSTPANKPATPANKPATPAYKPDITKERELTKERESPLAFVEYWKSKGNLPEIRAFTGQRKMKFKARMTERLFADSWKQVIDKISASKFCTGQNDRQWKATVDWLLNNSTNYVKVLEGRYDDPDTQQAASVPFDNETAEQREKMLAGNG